MASRFMSVADCQAELGLKSPKPILKAIETGELAAVNVSSGKERPRWRIAADAWESWLESRTAKPVPKPIGRRKRPQPSRVTQYF